MAGNTGDQPWRPNDFSVPIFVQEIIANLAQLACIAGIIMVWRLSEFDNRARQQNADSVQTPWLASASASFMMFMHAS
jgi:hypothetical protein